jgi:hypothetical protein
LLQSKLGLNSSLELFAIFLGNWRVGPKIGPLSARNLLNADGAKKRRMEKHIAAMCAQADGITFLRSHQIALSAENRWLG